jgi:hypothetical protein
LHRLASVVVEATNQLDQAVVEVDQQVPLARESQLALQIHHLAYQELIKTTSPI